MPRADPQSSMKDLARAYHNNNVNHKNNCNELKKKKKKKERKKGKERQSNKDLDNLYSPTETETN